jgi:hypothetical protein
MVTVTPAARREASHVVYTVDGAPDITKRYAKTITFRPDQLTVTYTDGGMTSFAIAGYRVVKAGLNTTTRYSQTYHDWDEAPEWTFAYLRLTPPTILVTRDDLLRILAGSEMGCSGTPEANGAPRVLIRMYTPDELLEAHRRACEDGDTEPSMTRTQAVLLTTPTDLLIRGGH